MKEKYEIKFTTEKMIVPGVCVDCYYHFANMKPRDGEPSTGCGLSGEFLPDDWNTEEKPWDRCPVISCKCIKK